MSLYFEAAAILANPNKTGGSLKSRIYRQKDLKSPASQLVALITEASKWSAVLKDVIEKSGLLGEEKKLSPILALLLTHDLLIAKRGVAAPANHVLKLAITRHKARLNAEFTKGRIRGGHATLEAYRDAIGNGEQDESSTAKQHPRWVRLNTLTTTLDEQLASTFAGYSLAETLQDVMSASGSSKIYFVDQNIPNLLALPPRIDLSKTAAYARGQIIFQDKASCFPAYLLDVNSIDGDVIDGCAAPGNKTTHLAALVTERQQSEQRAQNVIAFERDQARAKILEKMVKLASADVIVSIKGGHDFLAANPSSGDFSNVGAILLDPSCSGSGIIGRDDTIKIHLPDPHVGLDPSARAGNSKKRKRGQKESAVSRTEATLSLEADDSVVEQEVSEGDELAERLDALSAFQLRIVQHAMQFPKARKITYSTCSVHFEENEGVVVQALASAAAKENGWRILKRKNQVEGMKQWPRRGVWDNDKYDGSVDGALDKKEDVVEACIRCEKGTEDGTMGFFVAGFVREHFSSNEKAKLIQDERVAEPEEDEEEWNGFSDDDGLPDTIQHTATAQLDEQGGFIQIKHRNKKKRRR